MGMLDLENRLLNHRCRLAFLADITAQTRMLGEPDIELSEAGRYGLSLLLRALEEEAKGISTDVLALLFTKKGQKQEEG